MSQSLRKGPTSEIFFLHKGEGTSKYLNQCCHKFFGNFQITHLCYPNILATKNPNNNFMRNNTLKCVHYIMSLIVQCSV